MNGPSVTILSILYIVGYIIALRLYTGTLVPHDTKHVPGLQLWYTRALRGAYVAAVLSWLLVIVVLFVCTVMQDEAQYKWPIFEEAFNGDVDWILRIITRTLEVALLIINVCAIFLLGPCSTSAMVTTMVFNSILSFVLLLLTLRRRKKTFSH